MSRLPLRSELNATRRPSGDHVGSLFNPAADVSCQICSLMRGREIAEESGAEVSVRKTTVPTVTMAIAATATIPHNSRRLPGGGDGGAETEFFSGVFNGSPRCGEGSPRSYEDHARSDSVIFVHSVAITSGSSWRTAIHISGQSLDVRDPVSEPPFGGPL